MAISRVKELSTDVDKERREVEVGENEQPAQGEIESQIRVLSKDEAQDVVDCLKSALTDLEHACTLIEANHCLVV